MGLWRLHGRLSSLPLTPPLPWFLLLPPPQTNLGINLLRLEGCLITGETAIGFTFVTLPLIVFSAAC